MHPSGKHGAYLRLDTVVPRKLVSYFSKAFGPVQPFLGTEVGDTNALVSGRRGEFWKPERAIMRLHVVALVERWMPTIAMLLQLQLGHSWRRNWAISTMHD